MHYFLDGYNLLFRSIDDDKELQQQREELLKDLTEKLELLSLDVSIVFDAAYSPGGVSRTRTRHVEVIYTAAGESADSYIVEELAHCTQAHQETVITSDKKLAWQARRCGAKTIDIETFVTWLDSRYRNKIRKQRKKKEVVDTPTRAITRVPTAPVQAEPPPKQTPEGCFDYYAQAFEKRFQELPPETPKHRSQETSTKKTSGKKKAERPSKEHEPSGQSEEERYLRLFTERYEKSEKPAPPQDPSTS